MPCGCRGVCDLCEVADPNSANSSNTTLNIGRLVRRCLLALVAFAYDQLWVLQQHIAQARTGSVYL